MRRNLVLLIATLLIAAFAAGCASPKTQSPTPVNPPSTADPAKGTQVAPGLYDVDGGKVEALGTLEYQDLEGGFWVVAGGTQAQGDVGTTVAVIANGDAFKQQFEQLKGQQVRVVGTKSDGISIRMAGPEIIAESVKAVIGTSDPAQ